MSIWQTSIEETETQLSGPFRAPQQMLAEQEYDCLLYTSPSPRD